MGKGDKHKRIRIRIKLEDPKQILENRLISKLGFFYYLCCGVIAYGAQKPQKYCACCCICMNSEDVVAMVADKVMFLHALFCLMFCKIYGKIGINGISRSRNIK